MSDHLLHLITSVNEAESCQLVLCLDIYHHNYDDVITIIY